MLQHVLAVLASKNGLQQKAKTELEETNRMTSFAVV